jgi:outer membrane protein assembly factor BamD (BamD/ComL family)
MTHLNHMLACLCRLVFVVGLMLICLTGCRSLGGGGLFGGDRSGPGADTYTAEEIDSENGVVQARDETFVSGAKKSSNKLVGFISGREPENRVRAKELYLEADAKFRASTSITDAREKAKSFHAAAKLFRRAGEAAPQTALQQDAMFMQAESLFFADQLNDSVKVYEKLQKDFPRNRHNDLVAARLFTISRYWLETYKAKEDSWLPPVNLTDDKRPALDVDGHAIRVLDQIRFDDPTGRLSDDATMAAAAEYLRQEKFDEADEFLTDLREAFPDSEHLFLAHLLGIRCKLNIYAGPNYSALVLDEADKLIKQTKTRFPDKLQDPKYRDMIARASAEISYLRAEKLAERAGFREKKKEYRAARQYYQEILTNHADTPFADIAQSRLEATEGSAPVPTPKLAWLTTIFPDNRSKAPLQINTGGTSIATAPSDGSGETKKR